MSFGENSLFSPESNVSTSLNKAKTLLDVKTTVLPGSFPFLLVKYQSRSTINEYELHKQLHNPEKEP